MGIEVLFVLFMTLSMEYIKPKKTDLGFTNYKPFSLILCDPISWLKKGSFAKLTIPYIREGRD